MNQWEWNLLEDRTSADHVEIDGVTVRPGDRVRLHPREGGDILDLALRGQVAIVESIEEDYEGAQHICVVVDQDPGRDLGMMRQPGHRFFFTPVEIEPLAPAIPEPRPPDTTAAKTPSILIACIGNIFLGDDGFGVEVARRLLARPQPAGVRIIDFGIRGFDLAYALQDGYDVAILVDAWPHGQAPGAVSVVEPDLSQLKAAPGGFVQPHAMNPINVLRMAEAMNSSHGRVFLVGCEPHNLGGDEGHMGLSAAVEAAVERAVTEIDLLVNRIIDGHQI
jgi:hydrogenase maturation protease